MTVGQQVLYNGHILDLYSLRSGYEPQLYYQVVYPDSGFP
jgi:hypothetical protein